MANKKPEETSAIETVFGKPQGEQEKAQALKITKEDVEGFTQELREYMQGKQIIDQKIIANQEWWRLRHWEQMKTVENKNDEEKAVSAWLANSIMNKHADCMDNYPTTSVLPRSEGQEEEARQLSDILPALAERNGYEKVYSDKVWDFLVEGGCITSTLWDNSLNNGFGDVITKNVDPLNFFWQPGISDLKDSKRIFVCDLVDNDLLVELYPQMEGKTGGSRTIAQYINKDENVDDSKVSEVWDMYYHITVQEPVEIDQVTKEYVMRQKQVLHFVKFCNGELLYASENDPAMVNGWYEHGEYPFTITPLFKIKESPWGFGYVDIMQSPQAQIDRIDQLILKNAVMSATPRWAVREGASINTDDFTDWSKAIIEVGTSADIKEVMMEIDAGSVPGFVINHKDELINQLKETSGNRDVAQGGTTGGATAATAIAAMQEAGSKLIRDINKALYRGKRHEDFLTVKTMRQFYTEPRDFRVDTDNGQFQYIQYVSGVMNDGEKNAGVEFDIKIVAEKQSPFSKAAQNEIIKECYGMGLFAPENATAALVCIEGMDFEGKDKIKRMVEQNNIMMQQFNQAMNLIMYFANIIPEVGMAAEQAGLIQPATPSVPVRAEPGQPNPTKGNGTAEEKAAKMVQSDDTRTRNARLAAARHSIVK